MKRTFCIALFFTAIIFTFPAKAAAESIKNFEAIYNLEKSGHIQVTEKIEYDFGLDSRHGIYRYIPYKNTLDNGEVHHLALTNFKVEDKKGHSYKFEKYSESGNVVLKIGDPDRTITGEHTYLISYKVAGGFKYLETGDEFYWNVTGTGWTVPIERASARIIYPEGISRDLVKYACYSGYYGSGEACDFVELKDGEINLRSKKLPISAGLTVVAGFPRGTFEYLDAGFMGSGYSNATVASLALLASLIPVATFVFMIRHWFRYGRDPKGRGTIVAEYSAPDGLTPIEVGTLLDGRVDNKDLSAEIIYMAIKGHLKIRREEGAGIFKKDDYTLAKLSGKGSLGAFDSTLLDGIFGASDEVKMSSLKEDFYTHLSTIKTQVHDSLIKGAYFKSRVATTIGKYLAIAFGVGALGVGISIVLGTLTNGVGVFLFAPAFIVSALIVGGFGLAMPARTEKGVDAKERILGLKEYMSVAESDRIKFHNAPKKDPKIFEELLPYAMVLGVEKEWAAQFEDIYKGSPGWYSDPTGRVFMPIVFVNNLNSFNSVVTQNMTSPPSSSGSGFGGGGFSGGGFGGGGGGSW